MELVSTNLLIAICVAVNLLAFVMVGYDKRKSVVGNSERMPEGMMFFLASMFGAVGVFAGMQVFRHKTRKWYFQIGIPMLVIQNAATLYVLNEFFIY